MTRIVCALVVVIAVMALDQRLVQANEAPWCTVLEVTDGNMFWDCRYRSFEDCYPHLFGGNRGFCNQNPAYQGEPPRQRTPRHRVRQD